MDEKSVRHPSIPPTPRLVSAHSHAATTVIASIDRHMGFSSKHLNDKWSAVPTDVDVMVTHMPPFNMLDLAWTKRDTTGLTYHSSTTPHCCINHSPPSPFTPPPPPPPDAICDVCGLSHKNYAHWGCPHLYKQVVSRIRPAAHLFGHVHDANGVAESEGVLFSNAAMALDHVPKVIDLLPLKG